MAGKPRKYPLQDPLVLGETTVTELVFQPVNGGHIRRVKSSSQNDVAMLMELATLSCGQTQQMMDLLEGTDLMNVLEIMGDFMPTGPMTGEKP